MRKLFFAAMLLASTLAQAQQTATPAVARSGSKALMDSAKDDFTAVFNVVRDIRPYDHKDAAGYAMNSIGWAGIRLDESPAELRAQLGQPLKPKIEFGELKYVDGKFKGRNVRVFYADSVQAIYVLVPEIRKLTQAQLTRLRKAIPPLETDAVNVELNKKDGRIEILPAFEGDAG